MSKEVVEKPQLPELEEGWCNDRSTDNGQVGDTKDRCIARHVRLAKWRLDKVQFTGVDLRKMLRSALFAQIRRKYDACSPRYSELSQETRDTFDREMIQVAEKILQQSEKPKPDTALPAQHVGQAYT